MKRVSVEEFNKLLELDSALKDLKVLAFTTALENAKKSNQALANEITLKIKEHEARCYADACLDLGRKTISRTEYSLFQKEDDEMKIAESEELCNVLSAELDHLLEKTREKQVLEESCKAKARIFGEKAEKVKELEAKSENYKHFLLSARLQCESEREELSKLFEKAKKYKCKAALVEKIKILCLQRYPIFNSKQEIEANDALYHENIQKHKDKERSINNLYSLIESAAKENADIFEELTEVSKELEELKADFIEKELSLTKIDEKRHSINDLDQKKRIKCLIFRRKIENSWMSIHDLKVQLFNNYKQIKMHTGTRTLLQSHIVIHKQDLASGPSLFQSFSISSLQKEKNKTKLAEEIQALEEAHAADLERSYASLRDQLTRKLSEDLGSWMREKYSNRNNVF